MQASNCKRGIENSNKEPNIFDAIKSGLLIPTQNFVHDIGPGVLHQRDEKGYTTAHWACLNGHIQILRYLIEHQVNVNLPAEADPQPLPIHWACTNGHIGVVELLLQYGVSIDSVDSKGCTPLIVAAQYGKTVLAGYLMGKGAKLDLTDKDGDNALHWAAFKGQSELIRLLLYSGFSATQKDLYDQTPLHLACISGNLDVVKVLSQQDGVDLDAVDKNGKTPYLLAVGRNHEAVAEHVKKHLKLSKSILSKIDLKVLVFGPPGNSKYPILFFICMLLFWGYPIYLYKCLYYTWDDLYILHTLFWITNISMWFSLYIANSLDPGYLPRNTPDYDQAIKQVAHFTNWDEGANPLSKLCHTCRTVKLIRSKHCRICNRCVDQFDHHCPWIYNCVGYKNRKWFASFLSFVSFNYTVSLYFLYGIYATDGFSFLVISFIPLMAFALVMTNGLLVATLYQASRNITTNESANWKRYDYLKDEKGKFRNDFNRGVVSNLKEYFHISPRYRSDVSLSSVAVF